SVEEIIPILKNGKEAGCTEALFVFGEYAEEVPEYKKELQEMGYSSTIEYVTILCRLAIEIGLLPHTNAGILDRHELEMLKPLNVSMGLMLETTAELKAHSDSPGKAPSKRIEMIRTAGELQIPFTTGILVGIGESIEDRKHSLETIAEIHNEFGHIQEVIIQNFMPKTDTAMADHVPPTKEEMIETVSLARQILPDDVAVQVAPNLIEPHILIQNGATDLGGISPTTIDWINPEAEWPSVVELQQMTGKIPLIERLPIYPHHIKEGWYSSNLSDLIETLTDKNGFKRKQQ
ncbi:MAG: 7,8-didemethyl-8-hydroxy-5-deazariboflavin synthase CofG, partial [Methanosarcinales archaeon]|nr:7,8-didemethyl-8-hydroxy-5-deazariboflavin synthase CofG [Methanosarcinales archaeon]